MHPIQSCSVLLAAAFIAPGPLPDIIPDGVKDVASETRVALGPWAEGVHTAWRIEAGDTYAAIAKQQLGDGRRVDELKVLNSELDPQRLRIGQAVWLPARDAKVVDAPWLYVLARGPGGTPVPCAAAQPLPPARFASFVFFLVPDGKRVGFEKESQRWESLQKFVAAESIPNVTVEGPPRYVPKDAPIARIVMTLTLGKDAEGKLTASSARVDYDKAGKVLPPPALAADGKEHKGGGSGPIEPEPKKQWFLLLLALGGGGALWWRARRSAVRQALA